jgi:hypothetical protein
MRLFLRNISFVFNTLLPALSKTLYTSVVKFPASTSKQITKTLRPLSSAKWRPGIAFFTGPTGGSRTVPDLGCEQDGEEQSVPFLRSPLACASWCEAGHCREGEGRLSCFG